MSYLQLISRPNLFKETVQALDGIDRSQATYQDMLLKVGRSKFFITFFDMFLNLGVESDSAVFLCLLLDDCKFTVI